jgi:hypothetical protein
MYLIYINLQQEILDGYTHDHLQLDFLLPKWAFVSWKNYKRKNVQYRWVKWRKVITSKHDAPGIKHRVIYLPLFNDAVTGEALERRRTISAGV